MKLVSRESNFSETRLIRLISQRHVVVHIFKVMSLGIIFSKLRLRLDNSQNAYNDKVSSLKIHRVRIVKPVKGI